MAIIYISLGSNINREIHTRKGVKALQQAFGQLTLSSVYESDAVGFAGDAFYNMIIACEVTSSIAQTSDILRAIEDDNGRIRGGKKFSSRTLDLDLLLYDDIVEKTTTYTIPRGEILKRAFVLLPLSQIAPQLTHPIVNKTYHQLWQEFDQTKENLKPIAFNFEQKRETLASIACDLYVDISGTDCARPFSKLNDALDALQKNQTLLAVSKKQALQNDIPAFCRQRNLVLIKQGKLKLKEDDEQENAQYYFLIKH